MIHVDAVTKHFNGTHALDGFNLEVERGELFGLVGPNGAGKTTLMKVLATLLVPDSGIAAIEGLDVTQSPREVKRVLGYMPDQPGVYQDMTVREFLEFFADAFQLRGAEHRRAVAEALHRSGLEARSDVTVEHLSLGMKQRLVLAKTLLHRPRVLLLDEPATGLDPIARIELREQLKQLQAEGVTILISSHILSDLEDICARIALIGAGRNASDAEGHSVIQLKDAKAPMRLYEVELIGATDAATKVLASSNGVRVLKSDLGRLLMEVEGDDRQAAAVLRTLIMAGIEVVRFDHRAVGLEERYRLAFEGRPL